jgi:pimeloyl-ACP methyl ester carboxylesterase
MHFIDPEFNSNGGAKTLAIVLHGYKNTRDSLNELNNIIRETYSKKGGIDIYAPTMPYARPLDSTGANRTVEKLVGDLDDIWKSGKYQKVIFIGHSMGGVLLRRLFLAGSPNAPDFAGDFLFRDDLAENVTGVKHEWAAKVDRIIFLASWDKGWSISSRNTWKYMIGLNFLGFWGRVMELFGNTNKPGQTMFDVRVGAPFIVQTRLLWMAYRRWNSEALRNLYNKKEKEDQCVELKEPGKEVVNPLVIQIIGTQDNEVSPQDQVDYDINSAEIVAEEMLPNSPATEKKYFLIEMADADHNDVIMFEGSEKSERKKAFVCALTGDSSALQGCSRNPAYFEDMPTEPDPSVKEVVFVMHGIRDDGYWTHRIAKAIKEAKAAVSTDPIVSWTQTYGYFPMGAFLLPWIRRQKVEWFMDQYVNVKARYPNAIMHYVGHSNGTYLAAHALETYPAARFGQVYFAGSVVNPKYDWIDKIDKRRVNRFHNAKAAKDWVVALLPKSIEYFADLGGGGFDGFDFDQKSKVPAAITQSNGYADGDHGIAISEPHWPEIAKFIVSGDKPFGIKEPSNLFVEKQCSILQLFSRFRIGIPLAFAIVTLLILYGCSLWMPFEFRRWEVTKLTGEWDFEIWGSALMAFLLLQFFSKKAPSGTKGRLLFVLIFLIVLGIANLFFTTFYLEIMEFTKLSTSEFLVAFRTAGALLTLVGFTKLLRFILTSF